MAAPFLPDVHDLVAEERRDFARCVGQLFPATARGLERAKGETLSFVERTTCIELLAELSANWAEWQARLVTTLDAEVAAEQGGIEPAAEPVAEPTSFELIDESKVDENILFSRVVQQAEAETDSALREIGFLWARLGAAAAGAGEAYPLRPAVVARALRNELARWSLPVEHRQLLLREMGGALGGALAPVYARQLEGLAALDRSPGPVSLTLRTLPQDFGASAAAGAAPNRAAVQAGSALDELRAGLGAPDAARSGQAMAELMALVAQRIPAGQTLENLVLRLAGPARRIAEQAPEVWQSAAHPLWPLLDRILSAAAVRSDLRAGPVSDIEALESALQAIEAAAAPDAGDYQALEHAVDTAVSDLCDLQTETVAEQVDAMQLQLGRSDIETALRSQVAEQLRRSTAALAVRRFLLDTWVPVMGFSAQQSGVDGAPFRAQAALVDELSSASERCRHSPLGASEIARFISHARLAMTDAGFETRRIGVELAALARALRKPPTAAAGADSAAAPAAAAESPPPFRRGAESPQPRGSSRPLAADSRLATELGLHEALATVPLDHLDPSQPGGDGAVNAERWLDSLVQGSYCRLFLLDRWMNTRLSWRSEKGSMFIFASRHQGRSHSLSRRSLVKLRRAGLAATIERGESIAEVMAELNRMKASPRPRNRPRDNE